MSDAAPAVFLAPRSAAWICASLLAGLAGVVAFSVADHPTVEKFAQTTAAGDTACYTPPTPPLAVPEPVLTWQGRAVAPVSYDKVKIDDPQMTRVALDEATGLTLYRQADKLFIKLAVGEYLRVEPR